MHAKRTCIRKGTEALPPLEVLRRVEFRGQDAAANERGDLEPDSQRRPSCLPPHARLPESSRRTPRASWATSIEASQNSLPGRSLLVRP